MKFSLVMATLGRYDEIVVFLESLVKQTYKSFELIIIDQNSDDRLEKLCRSYPMNITLEKSNVKGLSVNRNIGLKYVSGDIIAFPDDDCEYRDDTLEKAAHFFNQNNSYNFYTCNVKERTGKDSILIGSIYNTEITLKNSMKTSISFTIFVRASSIDQFKFDEQLGVGAKYGSGEESDLILYLIKNKNRGYYFADTYIYHPNNIRNIKSLYSYGKGYGAFHKKAVVYYHSYQFLFIFFLVLIKEAIKLIILIPKKERAIIMKGRILGFLQYSPCI